MASGQGPDGAAQVVTEKVGEAIAAPDEFVKCLGDVTNYFTSLERLVEQIILTLCGKTADQRWGFRRKCRTVRDLLKPTDNEAYAASVCRWLDDCEEAAFDRNEAIHSPRARLSQGLKLQLGEDGRKAPVSVEQLAALKARIIALHSHGTVYKDQLPEVIERMAQAQEIR